MLQGEFVSTDIWIPLSQNPDVYSILLLDRGLQSKYFGADSATLAHVEQ